MSVELYHFPSSLCSQKARLVLAEKEIPWNGHIVNIFKGENLAPDYMKLNPKGVVPTLVHDGTPVTDSLNILRYVNREFPGFDLEVGNKGLIESWLLLQDKLPTRLLTYGKASGFRGWVMRGTVKPKRKQAGKAVSKYPSLKDSYSEKLVDVEAWEKGLKDNEGIKEAATQIENVLDVLEATLKKQRWLAGNEYSLADLAWTPVLARFEMLGFISENSAEKRPEVTRYFDHLKRRPSYEIAIAGPAQGMRKYFISTALARLQPLLILIVFFAVMGIAAIALRPQIEDFLQALN